MRDLAWLYKKIPNSAKRTKYFEMNYGYETNCGNKTGRLSCVKGSH